MTENIDEELAKLEAEIKEIESNPSGGSSSIISDKPKDTLMQLAREMLQSKDSRKFANLLQKYLGYPKIPVNNYLEIAEYCELEGMHDLAKVFKQEGENILATSLSIEGFFAKLLVTSIKKDEKPKDTPEEKKKSWGLFKKNYGVDQNGR